MTIAVVANARAILVAALSQAAALATLRVRNFFVALKDRQELRRLLASEDHRLADMGVDRDSLRAALSEPLWRDPTAALARRVKDKRGRRDGDLSFNGPRGERNKQFVRAPVEHHHHAIPSCPAVQPSMDIERYLAVLGRRSKTTMRRQS